MFRFCTCLLFIPLFGMLQAQEKERFLHLEHRIEGHTYQTVSMVQDTLGYLWISNLDGINKFNGYGFSYTSFKEIFGFERNYDVVEQIQKDPFGAIWIVSESGLISRAAKNGSFVPLSTTGGPFAEYRVSCFLPMTEMNWIATKDGKILVQDITSGTFTELFVLPKDSYDQNSNTTLVLPNSNELYIYTNKGRLFVYDLTTKQVQEILTKNSNEVSYNTGMAKDLSNRLWLCSTSPNLGLQVYDPQRKMFVESEIFEEVTYKLTKTIFSSILCDTKGAIWAGTDGNGLYKIDAYNGSIKTYKYNLFDNSSLSSNTVVDIYLDKFQNLWAANNYGNLNVLPNSSTTLVNHHTGALYNSPAIIVSTLVDSDGTKWFGTDGMGLLRVSPDGSEKQFLVNEDFSEGFYINTIAADAENRIWISTATDGIWIFNKNTEEVSEFVVENNEGLRAYEGFYCFRDAKNRMWIGTRLGIFVYDTHGRLLANYTDEDFGISRMPFLHTAVEDNQNRIWLGTRQGLFRLEENLDDIKSSKFIKHTFFDEEKESPSNLTVADLAFDGKENLWLVNGNGNFYRCSTKGNSYTSYSDHKIFESLFFKAVEVQDGNNIWLSSDSGIWHYNPEKDQYRTYFKTDGFLDNIFIRSSYKDESGNFYFANVHGINYFNPDVLSKKENSAKLFLENIKILNEDAKKVIPEQFAKPLHEIKELSLNFDQSSFMFAYAAIDNVISPNFYYEHRLKGYDIDWMGSNSQLEAVYSNVPPGDYVFEVRAGNNDGKWDIGKKTVRIHISPPFYQQTWAYLTYALIFGGILYWFLRWVNLNKRIVAEEVRHEQDKRLYDLKMTLFAKLSHEIQTPLTLILIPIEKMLQNALNKNNTRLQQRLRMIHNNAKRLSHIIFELTSIRNMELGGLQLNATKNNIINEVKETELAFSEYADLKKINFSVSYPIKEEIFIWYDKDKVQHILYNLLSNAFKYTQEGGMVNLDLNNDDKGQRIVINVKDTGIGIPSEELENIFKLFYRAKQTNYKKGMGIGLALVKELVDLHKGDIKVTSTPEKGTCFKVTLPKNEVLQSTNEKSMTENKVNPLLHRSLVERPVGQMGNKDFSKTLLIVEDSTELREFLKGIFEEHYKVITANDGKEGLELARKNLPHFILSDIMMPQMDGIEMSSELQKFRPTSHIPIVLLTADKTQANKIEALRTGVVEYIHKPFNVSELILRVGNIISRSDRLKEKFRMELLGTPNYAVEKSTEEVFLEKLVELIEERMADSEFKVETLSNELNMSYSVLYRKFQSLTGKTIVDFVRTMRLKKAAMYLSESNFNVSQAAYAVGFNDPKYFSKCFKKEFKETPKMYQKRHRPKITGKSSSRFMNP